MLQLLCLTSLSVFNSFASSTSQSPWISPSNEEIAMFNDWTTKPPIYVQEQFEIHVMRRNVNLSSNLLVGAVMKAISSNPRHLHFAEEVWRFLRSPQHMVKPHHLMFTQMMTMYLRAMILLVPRVFTDKISKDTALVQHSQYITFQAMGVVSEWINEYKVDPWSLQGELGNVTIHSPEMLNLMLRIVTLRENAFFRMNRMWTLHSIQNYLKVFQVMKLRPDPQTEGLLVRVIQNLDSLDGVTFAVEELVIPLVGKRRFLLLDKAHGGKITSKVFSMGRTGICAVEAVDAQLYAFRLSFLDRHRNCISI